ncbi:MAG TPA: YihY/virulence factor BrkB family protein [Polyangiaceae bacterium]|nr:YihY/virulence factor BrkB family protein [Polyangiaceae bacterium]
MAQAPLKRFWSLIRRVSDEADADDADIVAAGLAFYGTLGLFPALLASVSLYGLVADPSAIQRAIGSVVRSLPAAGRDVVSSELSQFVARSSRSLSLSLIFGLLAVLWSSSSAMGVLVRAINVAYDLPERRNFWQRRRMAVLFTFAGMLGMFVLMPLVAVLPKLLDFFHIAGLMVLVRWPAMALGACLTLGLLFRYSVERSPLPTVRSVLPGASVAAVLWVLLCAGYSAYVQYFTSFSSTYGALTGVIVLQFWLYVSALIVVYGAELNAELERRHVSGEQQELPLSPAISPASNKTATPRGTVQAPTRSG